MQRRAAPFAFHAIDRGNQVKFAKIVFTIAGMYGLLATVPLYFLEARIGADFPPAVTHPEYFYGFAGVCATWHLLLLIVARDPLRYRPVMLAAVLEKLSFAIAAAMLHASGRLAAQTFYISLADWLFAFLFIGAFILTRNVPALGAARGAAGEKGGQAPFTGSA